MGKTRALAKSVGSVLTSLGVNRINRATSSKRSGRRGKFGGRRFKTRRKRRAKSGGKSQDADDWHSGIASKFVVMRLHPKLKGRGLGTWKFSQNYSNVYQQNSGNQLVIISNAVCLRNQFLTDAATPSNIQIKKNLFDLNTDRVNSGSGLVPSLATPSTDRIAVYSVRSNMMFTNLESAACIIKLYWVTAKRDLPEYADSSWATGITGEGFGVAARTRAAPGVYGGTTAGSAVTTDVWMSPTDCYLWKKFYRIEKEMVVKLAAGATEEINVHIDINKIVSRQVISEITEDVLKRLSVQLLMVAYSQPVHDTTLGLPLTATTGAVRLAHVCTNTYHLGHTKALSATRLDDFFTNQQMADNVPAAQEALIDMNDLVAVLKQA